MIARLEQGFANQSISRVPERTSDSLGIFQCEHSQCLSESQNIIRATIKQLLTYSANNTYKHILFEGYLCNHFIILGRTTNASFETKQMEVTLTDVTAALTVIVP